MKYRVKYQISGSPVAVVAGEYSSLTEAENAAWALLRPGVSVWVQHPPKVEPSHGDRMRNVHMEIERRLNTRKRRARRMARLRMRQITSAIAHIGFLVLLVGTGFCLAAILAIPFAHLLGWLPL